MSLQELVLINFRNYDYERIPFFEGCHVFYGPNAQGKTNILESVYITAKGSSFKTTTDKKLIRFGQRSAYIRARIQEKEREKNVEIKFSMVERKRCRINEVEVDSAAELREQFDVVLFAPSHLELVKGSPAERRTYLDALLLSTDPTYRPLLRRYEKTLFQRNQLLKMQGSWFEEQLNSYDRELAATAVPIVKKRREMVEEWEKETIFHHKLLSNGKETCRLFYVTNCVEEKELFLRQLKEERIRDVEMRSTQIGPHRDEVEMVINSLPARLFASQGQIRTLTLSCKLAEMKIREKTHGLRPILLLDDVFSELDARRAKALLHLIHPYQSLVTTNAVDFLRCEEKDAHYYRVQSGHIARET